MLVEAPFNTTMNNGRTIKEWWKGTIPIAGQTQSFFQFSDESIYVRNLLLRAIHRA